MQKVHGFYSLALREFTFGNLKAKEDVGQGWHTCSHWEKVAVGVSKGRYLWRCYHCYLRVQEGAVASDD